MDAAIAQLLSPSGTSCGTLAQFYGVPSATTLAASIGLQVEKVGRTTELTVGSIRFINVTVLIQYNGIGGPAAKFVGQIKTYDNFCNGGDSGSLVVTTDDENHRPVGLLFAADLGKWGAYLNPIDTVLARFGATICGFHME